MNSRTNRLSNSNTPVLASKSIASPSVMRSARMIGARWWRWACRCAGVPGTTRAGLAERHRLLGGCRLGRLGVVRLAAHRLAQPDADERDSEDRDEQHHERRPPAERRGDRAGDSRADDLRQPLGVAMERIDARSVLRQVVVRQQRRVDRVVDQPAEAVAQPDQHEQEQSCRRSR